MSNWGFKRSVWNKKAKCWICTYVGRAALTPHSWCVTVSSSPYKIREDPKKACFILCFGMDILCHQIPCLGVGTCYPTAGFDIKRQTAVQQWRKVHDSSQPSGSKDQKTLKCGFDIYLIWWMLLMKRCFNTMQVFKGVFFSSLGGKWILLSATTMKFLTKKLKKKCLWGWHMMVLISETWESMFEKPNLHRDYVRYLSHFYSFSS